MKAKMKRIKKISRAKKSKIEFVINGKKVISQCMDCPYYIDLPILFNNSKNRYGLRNYCSKMQEKLPCFETEIIDNDGFMTKIPNVKECKIKNQIIINI